MFGLTAVPALKSSTDEHGEALRESVQENHAVELLAEAPL
jgi:hypothetical protein